MTEAVGTSADKLGPPHRFLRCDVTSPDDVNAFARETQGVHGAPDLLRNNAATINSNNGAALTAPQ